MFKLTNTARALRPCSGLISGRSTGTEQPFTMESQLEVLAVLVSIALTCRQGGAGLSFSCLGYAFSSDMEAWCRANVHEYKQEQWREQREEERSTYHQAAEDRTAQMEAHHQAQMAAPIVADPLASTTASSYQCLSPAAGAGSGSQASPPSWVDL